MTKPVGRQKVVLSVAGFDPSAGAGILADIKAISSCGCYGVGAVTSLTYQDTRGVYGASHRSALEVVSQIEPLLEDFEVAAVKTGMLPTVESISAVSEILGSRSLRNVVVDPVVRSTSGYDLIDDQALRTLVKELFPLADLVTPNIAEAERLTDIPVKDSETMELAGRAILAFGPKSVLVKGGDFDSPYATDLLMSKSRVTFISSPRAASRNTHGTGCTLASAIACMLAKGVPMDEAVRRAKLYVFRGIRQAPDLGSGNGPINHFPTEFDNQSDS